MSVLSVVKVPALVGVIASQNELRAAMRMRRPPDFFELRLDHLPSLDLDNVSGLRRPLIVTARHPAEGGKALRFSRRDLLMKFLPRAEFVDVELRSLRELSAVWKEAGRSRIGRICSVHHFARTPSHGHLQKQFRRARQAGADVFKLVTRVDNAGDLIVLLQLLRTARHRCCVMAVGKFGPLSRLLFPECGSVFVYAPLRRALDPGQLTLNQLRRLREFYAKT